ncbi:MAG: FAD-dependent oxidoreductase [Methylobacteriaceae bacterium]|nr:FAD-dependent oxidoreductase [Methylobacteriaceae bacterium]
MANETRCCIAGGGPAGMMLGYLLARAGVDVTVLEKHVDFLRDFRGDTIHPSTLELLHELGLLDRFLDLPHQEARQLMGMVGALKLTIADFSHLPTHCRFVVLMPQWDFLNFLAREAERFPSFKLRMQTQVTGLIEEAGIVRGVRAESPQGPIEIRADLVVGADGRHSSVRAASGLAVHDIGAPMDVLWFRLPRRQSDTAETLGRFDRGAIMVVIDRGAYWQCALVISKGSIEDVRARGLQAFRDRVAVMLPFLGDRLDEIGSWDDVKLLTVGVDRLEQWYRPGVLCIGDAAHTMSPIGGVGINLAIQDAVAAANILAEPLRAGAPSIEHLRRVQKRRALPVRMTQALQVMIQKRVVARVLASSAPLRPPLAVLLLSWFPFLRRLPARAIGLGVRPEHVRTPVVAA